MLQIISSGVRKKPTSAIFELLINKYFIVLIETPDNAEVIAPNNERVIKNPIFDRLLLIRLDTKVKSISLYSLRFKYTETPATQAMVNMKTGIVELYSIEKL